MTAYERFHQILKRNFAPMLRAEGFKGSGTAFHRIRIPIIHVVCIQGSKYGGKCCVNFGAHLTFLPMMGGAPLADPKRIREYHCAFQTRLHEPQESDHWWEYGNTEAESEAWAANLIEMYRRRVSLFFDQFEPFPDVFESITPDELESGNRSTFPFAMTLPLGALTMARIMSHLQHFDKCRQFAEIGLRHVAPRAVELKAELDRLATIS